MTLLEQDEELKLEPKKKFLKGRRLRIFAGPNGSGKSTIFNQVKEQYNVGIYINPDEIAQLIYKQGLVDLNEYGLVPPYKLSFANYSAKSSLKAKAEKQGRPLHLSLTGSIIKSSSTGINY